MCLTNTQFQKSPLLPAQHKQYGLMVKSADSEARQPEFD